MKILLPEGDRVRVMAQKNYDTEDISKWYEIVVEISKDKWIDVLLEMYEKVDEDYIPHFRFAGSQKKIFGFSIRMFSPPQQVIDEVTSIPNSRKIRWSPNPKNRDNDPLHVLSGWYEEEDKGPSHDWAMMLYSMSRLAIEALRRDFSGTQDRRKVVHQFCNMMALVEYADYTSRFNI